MITIKETELREVFEKHLPYEIARLAHSYQLLLQPDAGLARGIAGTVGDALIVASTRVRPFPAGAPCSRLIRSSQDREIFHLPQPE
jgi:hypothetical protein